MALFVVDILSRRHAPVIQMWKEGKVEEADLWAAVFTKNMLKEMHHGKGQKRPGEELQARGTGFYQFRSKLLNTAPRFHSGNYKSLPESALFPSRPVSFSSCLDIIP